jgi:site-specific DNA-cytosine methylase
MFRLVREIRPTWVIGENVAGIEGMALEQVVSDLESAGYKVAPPFEIPACAVGHDHRRARYWFLAYSDVRGQHERAFHAKAQVLPWVDPDAGRMGKAYGISDRMDGLGNAVVPQIPEIIGRAILACG